MLLQERERQLARRLARHREASGLSPSEAKEFEPWSEEVTLPGAPYGKTYTYSSNWIYLTKNVPQNNHTILR